MGRPETAECLGAERRKGPGSLNRLCGSQPGTGGVGPWEARVGSPDEVQLGAAGAAGVPLTNGRTPAWLPTKEMYPSWF